MIKNATIYNPSFWICLFCSIALLVGGFFMPPAGQIDGSVLTGVGELFGFATLGVVLFAMKKGVDARIKHGKTEFTVGDLNDKDNTEQL